MATRMLSHSEIEIGGGTQARAELNYFVIAEYAEAYKAGAKFPPLVVYDDGSQKWLARGFHRFHASKDAGMEKVECEICQGSKRDATWDAIADNQTHGLRRTGADKKRAVVMALKDKQWASMSNRAIADHVGVVESFVRKIRDESQVRTERTCDEVNRTGKDGKSYPATHKKRQPAPDREQPQRITTTNHAATAVVEKKRKSEASNADRETARQATFNLLNALRDLGLAERWAKTLEQIRADIAAA